MLHIHAEQGGPNPTELPKLLDPDRDVENYRFLFCSHYMHCLDTAVTSNWTSWSCNSCALFRVASTALHVHCDEMDVAAG